MVRRSAPPPSHTLPNDSLPRRNGRLQLPSKLTCHPQGFPTSIRRLEYFEEWAYSVNLIIWLNAPPSNDDLKQRLMARGDDSEWMIDQSLQEWDEEPLLAYLKRDWASNERNLFMVHGGSGSVEEVAAEVRRAVTSFMQQQLGKEKYKEQMDRTQRDLVTAERAHG